MGLEPFRYLMNDMSLRGIPMVLETEKDAAMSEDVENMRILKSLVE